MDDLIDRIGRRRPVGMVAVVSGQRFGDFVEPFVELALWPRVECGEATDDPLGALGNDQFGVGNDEQWRADDGQTDALEDVGKGHDQAP